MTRLAALWNLLYRECYYNMVWNLSFINNASGCLWKYPWRAFVGNQCNQQVQNMPTSKQFTLTVFRFVVKDIIKESPIGATWETQVHDRIFQT